MKIYILVCTIFISSCNTLPSVDKNLNCTNQVMPNNWSMEGRITIIAATKNSFSYVWEQQDKRFNILLLGLFGRQILNIQGTLNQSIIKILDKPKFKTSNLAHELYQQTGWLLPLEKMLLWFRGQAQSKHEVTRYPKSSCIESIMEDEYSVNYHKYKLVDNFTQPYKITIKKNNLTLKLDILSWYLHPSTKPNK